MLQETNHAKLNRNLNLDIQKFNSSVIVTSNSNGSKQTPLNFCRQMSGDICPPTLNDQNSKECILIKSDSIIDPLMPYRSEGITDQMGPSTKRMGQQTKTAEDLMFTQQTYHTRPQGSVKQSSPSSMHRITRNPDILTRQYLSGSNTQAAIVPPEDAPCQTSFEMETAIEQLMPG